jgi:hypothetical protein
MVCSLIKVCCCRKNCCCCCCSACAVAICAATTLIVWRNEIRRLAASLKTNDPCHRPIGDGLRFAQSCRLRPHSSGAQSAHMRTALSLGESSVALAHLGTNRIDVDLTPVNIGFCWPLLVLLRGGLSGLCQQHWARLLLRCLLEYLSHCWLDSLFCARHQTYRPVTSFIGTAARVSWTA